MPNNKILTSVYTRISGLRFFCLTCLLVYHSASSQETLQHIDFLYFSAFDATQGKLIRVFKDHYTLSGVTGDSATTYPAPGIGGMVATHSFHLIQGVLNIVKRGSGPVFQTTGGTIRRIDIALDHGFQTESIEFVRNDTLFRHGGHGLWEAHNFISYFNDNSRQWEIFAPIKSRQFPPGMFSHHGLLDGNRLFLFGGFTVNPYNRLEKKYNREVWLFDFSTKEWFNLGNIDPILAEYDVYIRTSEVVHGNKRMLVYNNRLFTITPATNEMKVFSFDQLSFRSIINTEAAPFIHKGFVYYYDRGANRPTVNLKSMLDSIDYKRIPISRLTAEQQEEGKLYHTEKAWMWWALLLLPLPGIILVLRKRQISKTTKEEKAIISEKGLLYQGILYELDPVPMRILHLLLSSEQDVPSSEILEITSVHEHNYPNKVRIKNRVIRNLNLELRSIFHTRNDILQQTDSAIDRRIKCYRLDRQYFNSAEYQKP